MATDQTQAGGTPAIDLVDFIDRQPVGGFQIRLLLTCAAVLFLDGFDTQAIGYVAPALAKEWGLTKGALGPVFSAGLFGLMIGALVFGPLADRVGRKKIIILSTAAFGLGALATALAQDLNTLLVIRFLTGLGLGGAMPNTVAMTSEYNPQRRRATMVMIMFCGFSIGAALGGFLAADLIPRYGWRSVFIVGGIAPLLLLPVLVWRLPESVRFLAASGQAPERVAELLKRISPHTAFAPDARFVVQEAASRRDAGRCICFGRAGPRATLLLWVVFFMSLLDIYFLANWLPTVLNDLGASVSAGRGDRLDAAGRRRGRHLRARQRDRPLFVPRAGAGLFRRGVRGRRDRPAQPFRRSGVDRDLRRGLLRGRRPDRRQCASGRLLPDFGAVDRRRLGARHRADRLDHRPAGRRDAAGREMEHVGRVHGRGCRRPLCCAGSAVAEPARWNWHRRPGVINRCYIEGGHHSQDLSGGTAR